MDFSNLPRYPEHEESPSPSQSDRLSNVDSSGPWLTLVFVLIPILVAFVILGIWIFRNAGFVNL
jgi:hypothetical protein